MSLDLFKQIIPSITTKKERVIFNNEDAKSYVPFIVNKFLSKHVDCIFFANEMNMVGKDFTNKMQYDFYYEVLRRWKRPFVAWDKKDEELKKNLEVITTIYEVSDKKGLEILRLLTEDQLKTIKDKYKEFGNPNKQLDNNNKQWEY